MTRKSFYDKFHKKNDKFSKLISSNNFSYFYILEFLQEHYMEEFSEKKILDIGCGVGTLALFFSKLGANVVGLDISERAIKIAKNAKKENKIKNLKFIVSELTKGKKNFDLLVCTEVIEHIPDDSSFLSLISSNLKKDGVLFLTTPSKENLLFKTGFYKQFDKEVGHLRRYKAKELVELVESKGFEVFAVNETEGILRNILFTTKLGFVIKFIKGPLVPLFHLFDRFAVKLFGPTDIMILASKK